MSARPTGTVTFLFTDIERSTWLAQQLRDRYAELLEAYRRLLRAAVERPGGYEFETQGDGTFIAFSSGRNAVVADVGLEEGAFSADRETTAGNCRGQR